jgi:adhesin transport system membrane fusion protein
MIATVEVLTGQKTVLDYMIKPARMLRDEALRER